MEKFKLSEYTKAIQTYMEANKKTPEDAVHDFLVNLATMKPYYEGFGDNLNFHLLGQRWNNLKYFDRSEQTRAAIQQVAQSRRKVRE